MKIGVIAAMQVEAEQLRELMSDRTSQTISGIEYHVGAIHGKEIVLAVCGIGKVNAAVCAQTMILRYGVSCIVNTGVAGGISGSVGVLDVVVATSVVQHDFDLTPLGLEAGTIMGIDKAYFPCAPRLVEAMTAAAANLNVRVHTGVIATGDQFLNDSLRAKKINELFGALAGEMEGGSIGQVCCLNDVDFCVVRTISDSGDDSSHMDFQQFCQIAAERSSKMIGALIEQL